MKTIIFMSGIFVPKWLAKSKFIWDKSHWFDYKCLWLNSKIPYSDIMVEKELDYLERLVKKYPGAILAGHSLGAWWVANLICRETITVKKSIFLTPLVDTNGYPIFNVTSRYNPCKQIPNYNNIGLDKTLVVYGKEDLLVPQEDHSFDLINHFKSTPYRLEGGHFYQTNHHAALNYMKEWVEL
jgi:predicted alpha/beta hydrolase family esterase